MRCVLLFSSSQWILIIAEFFASYHGVYNFSPFLTIMPSFFFYYRLYSLCSLYHCLQNKCLYLTYTLFLAQENYSVELFLKPPSLFKVQTIVSKKYKLRNKNDNISKTVIRGYIMLSN